MRNLEYSFHAAVLRGDSPSKLRQRLEIITKNTQQSKSKRLVSRLLNLRDKCGRTALHLAATYNRIETAGFLCEFSSLNPNIRDEESGWTALHRYLIAVNFRALYNGNLILAARIIQLRPDLDPQIKVDFCANL